jgi:hypothetical protein
MSEERLKHRVYIAEKKLDICIEFISKLYNSAKFHDCTQGNEEWNEFNEKLKEIEE